MILCGRRFSLLSVAFCFLLSGTSWAEVCFSDEEWEVRQAEDKELMEIFDELEYQSIQRVRELRLLRSDLRVAQIELIDSQTATEQATSWLQEAEKSLQEERNAAVLVTIVSCVMAFVVGIGAGLAIPAG